MNCNYFRNTSNSLQEERCNAIGKLHIWNYILILFLHIKENINRTYESYHISEFSPRYVDDISIIYDKILSKTTEEVWKMYSGLVRTAGKISTNTS